MHLLYLHGISIVSVPRCVCVVSVRSVWVVESNLHFKDFQNISRRWQPDSRQREAVGFLYYRICCSFACRLRGCPLASLGHVTVFVCYGWSEVKCPRVYVHFWCLSVGGKSVSAAYFTAQCLHCGRPGHKVSICMIIITAM